MRNELMMLPAAGDLSSLCVAKVHNSVPAAAPILRNEQYLLAAMF